LTIFLILLLAALVAWWFYRRTVPRLSSHRRWLLLALRALMLGVVLLLLLNPVLRRDYTHRVKPEFWLLRDVSASMDQPAGKGSKADLFSDTLDESRKRLHAAGYDPVVLDFAATLGDSARNGTRLAPALAQAVAARGAEHLAGVLLFSDGWLKDETLDDAMELGAPISAWLPDWQDTAIDLRVSRLSANSEAYVNEETPVFADVAADGWTGDATVTLLLDGRPVTRKQVSFATDAWQQVDLSLACQEPGLHTLEARIAAPGGAPAEPDTGNNRYPTAIQVRESRPLAVLLSDSPDWDSAFLRRALDRLPEWKSSAWQRQGNRWRQGTASSALKDVLAGNVRLVALVNHGKLTLSSEEAGLLTRYVENGGGLLLSGAYVTALADLLPGRPANLTRWFDGGMLFTEEARRYETFRRLKGHESEIPPIEYLYVTATPDAEVLATAVNPQESPLLLTRRAGSGRALWAACLGLWKWQLWSEGDGFDSFVGDISGWLGNRSARRFAAFTDRPGYRLGESAHVRLLAFDERMNRQRDLQPLLALTDSTGAQSVQRYLTLSDDDEYTVTLDGLDAGKYHYRISEARTGQSTEGDFVVSPLGAESADRGLNETLLSWLANRTGGQVYRATLPQWEKAQSATVRRHSELALYKKWYVIALFLLAFGAELFLRKRWGLL